MACSDSTDVLVIPLHIAARYGIYDVSPYVMGEKSVLASGDKDKYVHHNNKQHSHIRRIEAEMPSRSMGHCVNSDNTGKYSYYESRSMDITESAVPKMYEDCIETMTPCEDDTAPFPPMPSPYLDENIEWFDINNADHLMRLNVHIVEGTPLALYETHNGVEYTILCGFAITMKDYNIWHDQRYPDSEDEDLGANSYCLDRGKYASNTAYDKECGDERYRDHEVPVTACFGSCLDPTLNQSYPMDVVQALDLAPGSDYKYQEPNMDNNHKLLDVTNKDTEQLDDRNVSHGQHIHDRRDSCGTAVSKNDVSFVDVNGDLVYHNILYDVDSSQQHEPSNEHCHYTHIAKRQEDDTISENGEYEHEDDDQQPASVTEQSEDVADYSDAVMYSPCEDDSMACEDRKYCDNGLVYCIDLAMLFEDTKIPSVSMDEHTFNITSEHGSMVLQRVPCRKEDLAISSSADMVDHQLPEEGSTGQVTGDGEVPGNCVKDHNYDDRRATNCHGLSLTQCSNIQYVPTALHTNNHDPKDRALKVSSGSMVKHELKATDHEYIIDTDTPNSSLSHNWPGHDMFLLSISARDAPTPRHVCRSTITYRRQCNMCSRVSDRLYGYTPFAKEMQWGTVKENIPDLGFFVPSENDKVESPCHNREMVMPTDRPPPSLCQNSMVVSCSIQYQTTARRGLCIVNRKVFLHHKD